MRAGDPAAASPHADPIRGRRRREPFVPTDLLAITFDFGNTLVPVDRAGLARVVDRTAAAMADRCGPFTTEAFLAVWAEERTRQFSEEIPRFREVDIGQRLVRVLARLRGSPAPPEGTSWDDAAAVERSDAAEIAFGLETYSDAFIGAMPAPPDVGPLLARLASRYRLGVLSNWPLARTIDRYVEASGWAPYLAAVVVSQRVGTIKPHPAIFRAAEAALGLGPADGPRTLHVGDDWAADVVGAHRAGWRAAYLRHRPEDSPLPASEPDAKDRADLELDTLGELERAIGPMSGD